MITFIRVLNLHSPRHLNTWIPDPHHETTF